MNNKPMLFVTDDLAEGVYAASGNPEVPEASNVTYSLQFYTKYNNGSKDVMQYGITFTNNSSKKLDSVTVKLTVNGTVTGIGGNVSGEVNGTTATVTFNDYGNGIEPNRTYPNINMEVYGTGNFSVR